MTVEEEIEAAVDSLRRAGQVDDLPRGLLTRAPDALEKAAELIEETGYHRRDAELEDAREIQMRNEE
mgnify:CR=1 FL=1